MCLCVDRSFQNKRQLLPSRDRKAKAAKKDAHTLATEAFTATYQAESTKLLALLGKLIDQGERDGPTRATVPLVNPSNRVASD